ncbi:MAG: hypothetical protein EBU46_00080 [Nitrosomonadaceae bacterium]|nr:hypothetical protein [Nitrosomonadaceae bacterium]
MPTTLSSNRPTPKRFNIKDHNQILRPFSFKRYLRPPTDKTPRIAELWFSKNQLFHQERKVAVYRLLDFDTEVLVSSGYSINYPEAMELLANPVDVDAKSSIGSYLDTVYQGIGYYCYSIPLQLMVEEQHACVKDLAVHLTWFECNGFELSADIINELERYQLL